jgi:hypothetical protein
MKVVIGPGGIEQGDHLLPLLVSAARRRGLAPGGVEAGLIDELTNARVEHCGPGPDGAGRSGFRGGAAIAA